MIIIVGNKQLEKWRIMMSQFLDEFRAALEKVAVGEHSDAETKAAIATLNTRLNDNDTSDAEFKTAITELVNKLADSTPA